MSVKTSGQLSYAILGFLGYCYAPICFEHCQYAFYTEAAVGPLWFLSSSPAMVFIVARTAQDEKPYPVSRASG